MVDWVDRAEQIEMVEGFLGNTVYGVAGTLQAFFLVTKITAPILSTLPIFGVVYGLTELLAFISMGQKAKQQFYPSAGGAQATVARSSKRLGWTPGNPIYTVNNINTQDTANKEAKQNEANQAMGSASLKLMGALSLLSSVFGGAGSLYSGFALNAALNLIIAGLEWKRTQAAYTKAFALDKNQAKAKRDQAIAHTCIKALSLTGWILLAYGHPLGWVFLAATIVPYGYHYGRGRFFKAEEEGQQENTTTKTNSSRSQGHRLGSN